MRASPRTSTLVDTGANTSRISMMRSPLPAGTTPHRRHDPSAKDGDFRFGRADRCGRGDPDLRLRRATARRILPRVGPAAERCGVLRGGHAPDMLAIANNQAVQTPQRESSRASSRSRSKASNRRPGGPQRAIPRLLLGRPASPESSTIRRVAGARLLLGDGRHSHRKPDRSVGERQSDLVCALRPSTSTLVDTGATIHRFSARRSPIPAATPRR